jgi:hypothetical protein
MNAWYRSRFYEAQYQRCWRCLLFGRYHRARSEGHEGSPWGVGEEPR